MENRSLLPTKIKFQNCVLVKSFSLDSCYSRKKALGIFDNGGIHFAPAAELSVGLSEILNLRTWWNSQMKSSGFTSSLNSASNFKKHGLASKQKWSTKIFQYTSICNRQEKYFFSLQLTPNMFIIYIYTHICVYNTLYNIKLVRDLNVKAKTIRLLEIIKTKKMSPGC